MVVHTVADGMVSGVGLNSIYLEIASGYITTRYVKD